MPAIVTMPSSLRSADSKKLPQVSNAIVTTMDVMPTVLELVAAARSGGSSSSSSSSSELPVFDGVSLVPILSGGAVAQTQEKDVLNERVIFHYCGDIISAVRRGDYKMHYYTTRWEPHTNSCPRNVICGCGVKFFVNPYVCVSYVH